MKDVASTLFSNMYAAQERADAIKSKIESLSRKTSGMRTASSGSFSSDQASVQPFFPANLAIAMRPTNTASEEQTPGDYDEIIAEAADKNGVAPGLVKAVIKAESGFKPDAVSQAGAQGLMQLTPSTCAALGVSDPLDPAQNVEAGTRYLKQQIDRFGSTQLGLAAYNAGPGNVVKYNGIPPFNETKNYVSKVMGYLGEGE